MNKQVFMMALLLIASGANAAKKKPTRDTAPEQVATENSSNKKEPLRNIARESSKGHPLTKQEQSVFLEENLEDTADNVGMIRYTITVFKDKDRYSMGDWDDTTRSAVKRFKDVSSNHNDWVEGVIKDIRASLSKAFDPGAARSGIHAEVTIQMSSGDQPSDCKCGDKCACGIKYAGNCPCSLETPKAYPAEIRMCCLDRKK